MIFPAISAFLLTVTLSASVPPLMHMLLERTLVHVDVLEVDVGLDQRTTRSITQVTRNREYNDQLAEEIVGEIYGARRVRVTLGFLRSIAFDRFISEIRSGVECAKDAGVIEQGEYDKVADSLPRWFSALSARGVKKGDKLSYEISGHVLHTVYRTSRGEVLVDQTDQGIGPRRTVLGGYFAPCSEFREPLLRSLFGE